MRMQLLPEESRLLLPHLENYISECYSEIRHTMISAYKDKLKSRKLKLVSLLETLKQTEFEVVDLNPAQTKIFIDFLQSQLIDMPSEIWHTDNSRWRQKLKNEKRMLQRILKRTEAKAV